MQNMIDQPEVQKLIEPDRLRGYLEQRLPSATMGEQLGAFRVRGGHSNETFFIWRGSERWVLRRPPLGNILPTAHDVGREYRILSVLQNTAVPVPRPLFYCDDVAIIGAPFYLMEALDGVVLRGASPEWVNSAEIRREIGVQLVDALANLHAVDLQSAGLANFGKPEGYLERQVRRWMTQLDGARTRDIPALDAVSQWLAQHIPDSPRTAIVHGDYRLDNAMFANTLPVRLIGLLDWEMSTLGDPLADLGYLLAFWREKGDPPPALQAENAWRLTEEVGYPTRDEIIGRYAERTGVDLPAHSMNFYRGMAVWKMAIMLEGSYKRFLSGVTDDPFFQELERGVPALADWALQIVTN